MSRGCARPRRLPLEENIADAARLAGMFAVVDACPVPVVVRVQGAALGGGAGLCAVGDVVIAEASARFGFPEVRLGLVPATIAPFVVRRIGEGAATSLFTTGQRFDATEARRLGLVHRVVEGNAELDAAVDETVAAILDGGPRRSARRRRWRDRSRDSRGVPTPWRTTRRGSSRTDAPPWRRPRGSMPSLKAGGQHWALGDKHPT